MIRNIFPMRSWFNLVSSCSTVYASQNNQKYMIKENNMSDKTNLMHHIFFYPPLQSNVFFFVFFYEWEHRTDTMCPFSSLHPLRKGKEV